MEIRQDGKVLKLKNGEYKLAEALVLYSDFIYTIPKGYKTDLVTAPKFLDRFFPPHSPYAIAAIFHDHAIEKGYVDVYKGKMWLKQRYKADILFLRIGLGLGANPFIMGVIFIAVLLFGFLPQSIKTKINL